MTVLMSKPSLNLREELAKINSSEADKALVDGALTVKSAKVYGAVTSDSLRVEGDVVFTDDLGLTPKVTWDSTAEDLSFGDNVKAKFGNSGDLQIYHSGTESIIAENGTGDLKISGNNLWLQNTTGETYFRAVNNSYAKMYYDNAEKIATTSTGIGVTGTVTAETLNAGGSINYGYGINTGTAGFGINSAGVAQIVMRGTEYRLQGVNASPMTFYTANAERMRIDASGNVLVGTTSVQGAGGVTLSGAGYVYSSRPSSAAIYADRTGSDGAIQEFRKDGTTVGSVSVTGSATAYNTSSDYRLKTDVQPMTGATATFKQLKPVNFEWISSGERVDGFLAHELQEVIPAAATGSKDAMRDEEYEVTAAVYEDVITAAVDAVDATFDVDGVELTPAVEAVAESTESVLVTEAVMATRSVPDMQGIDQSKVVPLLTATIQELIARIEALEAL